MYVCILSLPCTSGMRKISSPREIFHGINFSFVALELAGSRRGGESTDEAMWGMVDQSLWAFQLPLIFLQFHLWEIKSPACIEIILGQFLKTWCCSRGVYAKVHGWNLQLGTAVGHGNLSSYCITSHWSCRWWVPLDQFFFLWVWINRTRGRKIDTGLPVTGCSQKSDGGLPSCF